VTEQPHPSAPENHEQKKTTTTKFQANSQYFTIAIYVIIVVAIAAVIFKAILSFEDTVAALHRALNLMMPFIIGALIAFILNPAVKKFCYLFEKYTKIKRKSVIKVLSILITYLLLLSLVFVSFFGIIPEIMDNLTDLINSYTTAIPLFLEETTLFFNSLEEQFPSLDVQVLQDAVNEIIPTILNSMKDFAANLVPTLYSLSMSIVQLLIDLIIALIVSVYMLTDKQILLNSFKAVIYAFLPQKQIPTLITTLKDCNNIFSSFIIGKAIDSLIIGILCFILMTILQLPYTLLISLIVGVTNMIPYFGPFIGAVPGIIIMLMISPIKALIFGLMILALQQFDGLILGPKILGDSVGLRPLWIIIAITIGGSIAGVLGMFLGVPIVAVIRYLMIRILKYRLEQRNILNNVDLE
jgi:predicted PurR-regulated permease PerM